MPRLTLISILMSSMSIATIMRQSDCESYRAYTSTVDQKSGDAIYNPGQ